MENKDIKITLQYNLEEVNHLLTLLGALPFNQAAPMIENIRMQAMPQLPMMESGDGGKVDSEGDSQAGSPA